MPRNIRPHEHVHHKREHAVECDSMNRDPYPKPQGPLNSVNSMGTHTYSDMVCVHYNVPTFPFKAVVTAVSIFFICAGTVETILLLS